MRARSVHTILDLWLARTLKPNHLSPCFSSYRTLRWTIQSFDGSGMPWLVARRLDRATRSVSKNTANSSGQLQQGNTTYRTDHVYPRLHLRPSPLSLQPQNILPSPNRRLPGSSFTHSKCLFFLFVRKKNKKQKTKKHQTSRTRIILTHEFVPGKVGYNECTASNPITFGKT